MMPRLAWGLSAGAVASAQLICAQPAFGAEPPLALVSAGSQARTELHLTAYRTGYRTSAFVREVREVELPAGRLAVSLPDVPNTVERASVSIRVLEGAPVEVLEQTYSYDLLSPRSMLESAEGAAVTFDKPNAHSGELQPIAASVVSSGQQAQGRGPVLRTAE